MTKHSTGTREEWLAARLDLLGAEKEHTRRSDDLARRRQELPRVRIDKEYRFETDEGSASLADLFRADAHKSSSRRAHSLRCRASTACRPPSSPLVRLTIPSSEAKAGPRSNFGSSFCEDAGS